MIEIFIIYSVFFVYSIVEFSQKKTFFKSSKYYKLTYVLLTFFLIVFTGFRPLGLDRDSLMYLKYFEEFQKISYYDVFFNNPHRVKEIGFIFLNKFFYFGYREMLLFISLIVISIKSFILFKYSKLPIFSNFIYLSLFFLLRDYTQIRDALAVTFLICSLLLFYHKKKYWSVIVFLLAVSFHFIALIFIPVVLILSILRNNKTYYWIISAGIVFYILNPLKYITHFNFLPDQILKYENYTGTGSFSVIFFGILTFIIFHHAKDSIHMTNRNIYSFLFKTSALAVFFGFTTINHPALFRITNALMFFAVLLVSNMLFEKQTRMNNVFFAFLILFLLFIFLNSLRNGLLFFDYYMYCS